MQIKKQVSGWLKQVAVAALGVVMSVSAVAATDTVTYFHNDISGTPMLATDAAGQVVWKEAYRPFGEKLTNSSAAATNKVGYAGKPFDNNTGLSYMGARYYNPVLGRFTGIDPKEVNPNDLHSFNRYVYANNNPYKYVDPDGRSVLDVAFLVYDLGKLGLAVYSGNPAAILDASKDVAISAVGVASPVPGMGEAYKAARVAEKGLEAAKDVGKVAEAAGASKALEKATHGNKIDGRPATLYEKYDKDGNFLKHGITKHEDPVKRYSSREIDGGTVVRTDRGPRSEMIKKERDLVERSPGPQNKEPWAGSRLGE